MRQLDSILKLANKFSQLPGVGAKTALRYAYSVIDMSEAEVDEFCSALKLAKQEVRFCSKCGGFTDKDVCDICSTRDEKTICVVAYPKDVFVFERVAGFRGVYHVLGGTLSPIDGRGPDDLRIKQLFSRLENCEEVIVATNPDVEGEATAAYLAKVLRPFNVKVTRLARGISMGTDIEYADEATLGRALEARTEI